ncbi:hypothetical protein Tco_0016169 [Tanacetum coccineum]
MVSTVKLPILRGVNITLLSKNGADAKFLWAAIKSRIGVILHLTKCRIQFMKQQFKLSVSDTEGIDKAYESFKNLSDLLEVHGVVCINDLDIDDLYNNLKVFEADIKGSSGSSSNSQNVAFLSAEDTSLVMNQVVHNWMLKTNNWIHVEVERNGPVNGRWPCFSMGLSHFVQENWKKVNLHGKEPIGFDKTKMTLDMTRKGVYIITNEPTEFALMAYTSNSLGSDTKKSVEAQLVVHQKNEAVYEEKIAVLEFEVKDKSNAVTRLKNQLDETLREKDDLKAKLEQFKKDNGYHVVPPPLTKNYMPPLADLSFVGLDDSIYKPTLNKTSASVSQVETSITPPSNTSVEIPRVKSVRLSGVIIEDWVSDDDDDIFQSNDLQATNKRSFKRIEFTNARNESVKVNTSEEIHNNFKNQGIFNRDVPADDREQGRPY